MKTAYMVQGMRMEISGTVLGHMKVDIPLMWADGMIGALPVFDTYEKAEAYANGKLIQEITYREE